MEEPTTKNWRERFALILPTPMMQFGSTIEYKDYKKILEFIEETIQLAKKEAVDNQLASEKKDVIL